MKITQEDYRALQSAAMLLKYPTTAARITNAIGMPIEAAFKRLPVKWLRLIQGAASLAIEKALHIAIQSIGPNLKSTSMDTLHKVACGVSGGLGGFFGAPALAMELPVSTTIMLRSIAQIAQSEGEDLAGVEARLACLEVFALGGTSTQDDAAETGYFAIRAALAAALREAASVLTERGIAERSTPALVRLVSEIASRFGATAADKVAAEALPVIGAIGGATINVIFMDHFQNMARGHFTVRRLERRYGSEVVRAEFDRL